MKKYRVTTPWTTLEFDRKKAMVQRLKKEKEVWHFLNDVDKVLLKSDTRDALNHVNILDAVGQFSELIDQFENATDDLTISIATSNDRYWRLPPFIGTYLNTYVTDLKNDGQLDLALKVLMGAALVKVFDRNQLKNIDNHVYGFVAETRALAAFVSAHGELSNKRAISSEIRSALIDVKNKIEYADETTEKLNINISENSTLFDKLYEDISATKLRKSSFLKRLIRRGLKENQKLQDRFLVQMRYRAPVALWEKRRIEHQKKSNTALAFFIGGIAVLCISFISIAFFLGDTIAASFTPIGCSFLTPQRCAGISPKGVLYTSTTLLVASMFLWMLRLQMKVYLSERHLSLDAEEKKAFAETYLALKEDSSVNNAEQEAVVLQSLFRPTQDGIIRDDNMVETSPAGLIAKMLEGRR